MPVPVQARRCQLGHQTFLGETKAKVSGGRWGWGVIGMQQDGSCRGGSGRVMQDAWL